ncbi:MAG: ABC transporter permease [Maricaulaceae bacterium]
MLTLRSLPQRLWLSSATVLSIALVVGVLLAFLAMAAGFEQTLEGSGAEDVAVILAPGSGAELSSGIGRDQVTLLSELPGIARDPGGDPIASAEVYAVVEAIKRSTGTPVNTPLRGIGPQAIPFRPGFEIVEGRMFEPGTNEIIVGRGLLEEFSGFELGARPSLRSAEWVVVGVFAIPGTVFDSELWADRAVVQNLTDRGASVSSMRVRLDGPNAIERMEQAMDADPRLDFEITVEKEYFGRQSQATSSIIRNLGWPVSILMALGALAGALNTMYASVEARTREIATLRAIGFMGMAGFVATLAESLVLSALGGLIGAVATYLVFDGLSASTLALGGSFTQIVFAFNVGPQTIANGVTLALIIGVLGGFAPAWRAARAPLLAVHRAS